MINVTKAKKMTDPGGKVVIIVIMATMVSSSIIMTEIWILYLTILYSVANTKINLNYLHDKKKNNSYSQEN